jgi:hypothetical protein
VKPERGSWADPLGGGGSPAPGEPWREPPASAPGAAPADSGSGAPAGSGSAGPALGSPTGGSPTGGSPTGGDAGDPAALLPEGLPPPHLPPDPASVAGLLDLLVRDLQRALYSEFGALSLYALLPRWTRQRELGPLLRQLLEDERRLIPEVSALIERLGGRAPRRRWTRSVAALGLFLATPVVGLPFALRLCREAETAVSRWYAQHTVLLYQLGRFEEAQSTRAWSQTKHIHAVRLSSFIDHLRRGE